MKVIWYEGKKDGKLVQPPDELTSKVMTEYNKRLNEMVQTLVSSDSPMRTAVVNILAFGGPVASGTAGVVGFAAGFKEIYGGPVFGYFDTREHGNMILELKQKV